MLIQIKCLYFIYKQLDRIPQTKRIKEMVRNGLVRYESMKKDKFEREVQAHPDYIPTERREIEKSYNSQKDNLFKQN